ncbi:unnamed protein product [Vicia faba]|uniref:Uncharacterized protein n=1 Tax=Vicia faba TaxID=3906 RepID=A0AAV1B5F5_VICFA|nr:unnamed protein product [Vicia faba]
MNINEPHMEGCDFHIPNFLSDELNTAQGGGYTINNIVESNQSIDESQSSVGTQSCVRAKNRVQFIRLQLKLLAQMELINKKKKNKGGYAAQKPSTGAEYGNGEGGKSENGAESVKNAEARTILNSAIKEEPSMSEIRVVKKLKGVESKERRKIRRLILMEKRKLKVKRKARGKGQQKNQPTDNSKVKISLNAHSEVNIDELKSWGLVHGGASEISKGV